MCVPARSIASISAWSLGGGLRSLIRRIARSWKRPGEGAVVPPDQAALGIGRVVADPGQPQRRLVGDAHMAAGAGDEHRMVGRRGGQLLRRRMPPAHRARNDRSRGRAPRLPRGACAAAARMRPSNSSSVRTTSGRRLTCAMTRPSGSRCWCASLKAGTARRPPRSMRRGRRAGERRDRVARSGGDDPAAMDCQRRTEPSHGGRGRCGRPRSAHPRSRPPRSGTVSPACRRRSWSGSCPTASRNAPACPRRRGTGRRCARHTDSGGSTSSQPPASACTCAWQARSR